ncbi:MAG: aldolase/citrate lyase family protein, partial [Thermomicrobium sp.]|nr:aldolase/citrate lyase family protein [Thermomicrobium sp.]
MRLLRSALFVPGHRGAWVEKAVASGADALFLDLEDSVPTDLKGDARREVASSITRLHEEGIGTSVYVRPNSLETGLAGDDIEAVSVPGLAGLVLPKIYGPEDV